MAPLELIQKTGAAIASAAEIINVSQGIDWEEGFAPNHEDSVTVAGWSTILNSWVSSFVPLLVAELPLMVVSAGNDGLRSFWSLTPNLSTNFPDRVIVVAASARDPLSDAGTVPLWDRSNHGDLIDIVAPGEEVYTLDGDGSVIAVDGTSIAAPFVAGAAGLLLSFDSTLTAPELKELIIEGAERGGHRATGTGGPYPFLHVYESLKLAARRSDNGRLCGSRVVVVDGEILVERESGWKALASIPGRSGELNIPHDGEIVDGYRFDENDDDVTARVAFHDGAWSLTGDAPSLGRPPRDASFLNSAHGRSHSGDTTAVLFEVVTGPVPEFNGWLLHAGRIVQDLRLVFEDALDFTTDTGCTLKGGLCVRVVDIKNGEFIIRRGIGYFPQGKRLLAWSSIVHKTETLGPAEPCGVSLCRDVHQESTSVRTDVYLIELESGETRKLWTVPHAVLALGISEDGKEVALSRAVETVRIDSHWEMEPDSDGDLRPVAKSDAEFADEDCSVEFRDARTGELLSRALLDGTCWRIVNGSATVFDLPAFGIAS